MKPLITNNSLAGEMTGNSRHRAIAGRDKSERPRLAREFMLTAPELPAPVSRNHDYRHRRNARVLRAFRGLPNGECLLLSFAFAFIGKALFCDQQCHNQQVNLPIVTLLVTDTGTGG